LISLGAAPAPAPAPPPLGGPVVAGVCLLSREALVANAAVGKAATARLQELTRVVQAEIEAERAAINADVQKFQAEQATMTADQRAARQSALEVRVQAVQVKAAQREQEIEATRLKALDRISVDADPVIAQVYAQKQCGLVLDRGLVLGGNYTNDLTPDVVKGLDAKVQTITFEREVVQAPTAR